MGNLKLTKNKHKGYRKPGVADGFTGKGFDGTCDSCGQPYCMDYVRDMENTLVVSKQAIETMQSIIDKLTKQRNEILNELKELKDETRIIRIK